MPIYQYRCSQGHVTEVKQTSFEPYQCITCPECSKEGKDMRAQEARLIISQSDFEIKNKPIGEKKWDV